MKIKLHDMPYLIMTLTMTDSDAFTDIAVTQLCTEHCCE